LDFLKASILAFSSSGFSTKNEIDYDGQEKIREEYNGFTGPLYTHLS